MLTNDQGGSVLTPTDDININIALPCFYVHNEKEVYASIKRYFSK